MGIRNWVYGKMLTRLVDFVFDSTKSAYGGGKTFTFSVALLITLLHERAVGEPMSIDEAHEWIEVAGAAYGLVEKVIRHYRVEPVDRLRELIISFIERFLERK